MNFPFGNLKKFSLNKKSIAIFVLAVVSIAVLLSVYFIVWPWYLKKTTISPDSQGIVKGKVVEIIDRQIFLINDEGKKAKIPVSQEAKIVQIKFAEDEMARTIRTTGLEGERPTIMMVITTPPILEKSSFEEIKTGDALLIYTEEKEGNKYQGTYIKIFVPLEINLETKE